MSVNCMHTATVKGHLSRSSFRPTVASLKPRYPWFTGGSVELGITSQDVSKSEPTNLDHAKCALYNLIAL